MKAAATKALRLSNDLVSEAEIQSHVSKRSVPMQIEYWASIGHAIEEYLTPKDVDALFSGRAEVHIEPKVSRPANLSAVFGQLEADRRSGDLQKKVVTSKEWFEISKDRPGHLVKVTSDGSRTIGKFEDGEFKALS